LIFGTGSAVGAPIFVSREEGESLIGAGSKKIDCGISEIVCEELEEDLDCLAF
jgi:hypothetical protein